MSQLERIPLPTVVTPKPTFYVEGDEGIVWDPKAPTTKDANLKAINAAKYNRVTRGMSILIQRSFDAPG